MMSLASRPRASWLILACTWLVVGTHPPRPLAAQGAPAAISGRSVPRAAAVTNTLPDRLSDADFWKLETDISEPGGYFRIEDNYTSNEPEVAEAMTMLRAAHRSGGVYVGVGPEQNLSYIAAIRPQMAFICDIRREAVMQHLLYKAVFELSKDRADFISILFTKPRPAGLDSLTPITKIWDAFWTVPTDTLQGAKNYQRIVTLLTKTHGFTFTADESAQLKRVFDAFYNNGPNITTTPGQGGGGGRGGGANQANFADLTGYEYDYAGQQQSFMTTEDNFRAVKALEDKNLVVPVSGDFGGPKALRAIGAYVTAHGATVTAFYVSNVEQYLFQDAKEAAFYSNVATFPVTDSSVFIRPYGLRTNGPALCPISGFLKAFNAGRADYYNATLACVQ